MEQECERRYQEKNASPGPGRSSSAGKVPGGQVDRLEKTATRTKSTKSDRKRISPLTSQDSEYRLTLYCMLFLKLEQDATCQQ